MESSLHVYTVICQGEGEGHRLCTLTLEFRSLIYISDILEWNLHYMSILLYVKVKVKATDCVH